MPDIPVHITAMLSALNFSGDPRETLRTLTDPEWGALLARWETLRLMVPLRQICGDELPEWVRSQIDQNLVDNAERFERIKVVYSEFVNALGERGAEHLVIKGFAQSPDFVGHPRDRFQGDIDVYCPPESIFHARDTLSTLGYEPVKGMENVPSDHLPTMSRKTDWKWRGNFYDPEMPIPFELHFCFWDEKTARFGPKGLDLFWARRVERRLDHISFPALHPTDNLGYFALNVLRDVLRGGYIAYNVYELAQFLHTNADNEPFWKDWRELHNDSLRSLEAISFRLALDWFACRLPDEVEREINRLPGPVQSWFERFGHFPRRAWFRPNKDGLWLHSSLLEFRRDKRIVAFERLFPRRIPSIEASHIQAATQGWFRKRTRYVTYLASRTAYHARLLPATLWQGLRWWLTTKNMSRGFRTFFAASFFFDFGMYIFFVLYNLYLLDCGFKENFVGLVASASAVGSIAGTIPAGFLAQRLGLRRAFLLCVTFVPLTLALRSLLIGKALLLGLAFVGGAAITVWGVCMSPAIAQLTNDQTRPFGFSVIFSEGIAMGILGGQAGGRLPEWLSHIGPLATPVHAKRVALLIACGMIGLAAWPISRLKFPSVPSRERTFYPRNPFLVRFLPAIAIWSLAMAAFGPFFNVYFSQYLHVPVKQIGNIYSLSQLSQVLAVLVAPVVFRKFGLLTGIVYTQIATAMALAFLATGPGVRTAASFYIGYTAFQWMSEPGIFGLLMNQVADSERAGASALNLLAISVSQAIAAAAAGASFVRFGYPVVLSVTAGMALAAAFLFRLLLGKLSLPVSQRLPTVVDP